MPREKKIKVFCPVHNQPENAGIAEDSSLMCENGARIVKEFPPQLDAIFYCCICSCFIPEEWFLEKPVKECPDCNNGNITAYYLCDDCRTIAFDNSVSKAEKKTYIKDEVLKDACPACSKNTSDLFPVTHECRRLKLTIYTSRQSCIYCSEPLFQDNKFLVEQLRKLKEKNDRQDESIQSLKAQIDELSERAKIFDVLSPKQEKTEAFVGELKNLYENLTQKFEDLRAENGNERQKAREQITTIERQLENYSRISEAGTVKFGAILDDLKEEMSKHLTNLRAIFETANTIEIFADGVEALKETGQAAEERSGAAAFDPVDNSESPEIRSGALETAEFITKPTIKKYTRHDPSLDDDSPVVISGNISSILAEIDAPVSLNLPRFVADILNQFPEKQPLVQYPMIKTALKSPNSAEQNVLFYHLRIGQKDYVVPASGNVQNQVQFTQYARFYKVDTSRLNGKIEIVTLAEVNWDDSLKGYRLRKQGVISILL